MILYFWMMIQVVCESLPISSSGHVALIIKLVELFQGYNFDQFLIQSLWSFDYFLQGISAILILFYFFSAWWNLVVVQPISFGALKNKDLWLSQVPQVLLFGLAADGVTFLLWSLDLPSKVKLPLAFGFFITQMALLSTKFYKEKKDISIWSWKNGMIVGFIQGCALFPGVSRFATTVAMLQYLGYSSKNSFSISFLIQWPLIVAGSLKGFFALKDPLVLKTILNVPFLVIMIFSAIIAYALLCFIQKVIDKKMFWSFSIYMFVPIVISLFC